MKGAIPVLWNWPPTDEGRAKRASKLKFEELDLEAPFGVIQGSDPEPYQCTLQSCTCKDYYICRAKGIPQACKHMIALGMKVGLLNENGLTPPQQREADIAALRAKLASAYGYYYLFDSPIISDKEYDESKSTLAELLSKE